MEKYYLGIDVGGTSVKIGIISSERNVVLKNEYSVNFDNYQTPIIQTVCSSIEYFIAENDNYEIAGVGVCATGQIDVQSGSVIGTAGHIDNYLYSNFMTQIQEATNKKCTVINDADAVALSEYYSCGKRHKNLIVITIGTGVGGGIINDGRLMLGARGLAGELGHVSINYDGKPCYCGKKGCLELYTSANALIKDFTSNHYIKDLDGKVFFDLVEAQHIGAQESLNRWIGFLSAGLSNLIHTFNPDKIILGGGITKRSDLFLKDLKVKTFNQTMPAFKKELEISVAQGENNAGMIGAVDYFKSNFDQTLE